MKLKVVAIAGARPNFMKVAPVVHALKHAGAEVAIVHTGQHYDAKMSDTFFQELGIPAPDRNLGVGSGSHAWQIAEVMQRLEPELKSLEPHVVVVVGDVNSTVAAAITAVKMDIPVAHVEAGLRSFDRTMPEETNRILTDAISQWLFTSEPSGEVNLRNEGVPSDRIHFVGNVMIDTLMRHSGQARAMKFHETLGLRDQEYAVMTLHRPSNVDDPTRLKSILDAVHQLSSRVRTVFVVHPRTSARLKEFGFGSLGDCNGSITLEPVGYMAMLSLMCGSRFVMTDSGGIQEETTALGVPCLTLRDNTERPITAEIGTNELVGWQTDRIVAGAHRILENRSEPRRLPEKWDGAAAPRIADVLMRDPRA